MVGFGFVFWFCVTKSLTIVLLFFIGGNSVFPCGWWCWRWWGQVYDDMNERRMEVDEKAKHEKRKLEVCAWRALSSL